jgi:NADH-quinone oxidoreductase subunit C
MPDIPIDFPQLKALYEALGNRFGDALLEGRFEKEELTVKIKKEELLPVLKFLKFEQGFNALNDMIGLDNFPPAGEDKKRFSILYQLYKFPASTRIRIAVDVGEEETVDSLCAVYKSANWAEREIFDMFGIFFSGHPDLRRIYLPEDFDGFPLRKDFPLEGKDLEGNGLEGKS